MMGRRCTLIDFFHHKGHEEHKDECQILFTFSFLPFVVEIIYISAVARIQYQ
jgi:hypothetical protein